MQRLIVTAVSDDFFKYAEQKGMEMDLEVKHAWHQTAFMLEVLNQIRKDAHALDKKQTEATEGVDVEVTRGPLLRPLVYLDEVEIGAIPAELVVPVDLEFVVFESVMTVGFYRLRKALLLNPTFIEEALFIDALNYIESTPTNIRVSFCR
jgi:hypothetical protein